MLIAAALAAAGCGGGDDATEPEAGAGGAAPTGQGAVAEQGALKDSFDEVIAGDMNRNLDPHRATQYGQRVFDVRVGGGVARIFTTLPPANARSRQYASYICAAAYGPRGKAGVPGLKEAIVVMRERKRSLSCDDLELPKAG